MLWSYNEHAHKKKGQFLAPSYSVDMTCLMICFPVVIFIKIRIERGKTDKKGKTNQILN